MVQYVRPYFEAACQGTKKGTSSSSKEAFVDRLERADQRPPKRQEGGLVSSDPLVYVCLETGRAEEKNDQVEWRERWVVIH